MARAKGIMAYGTDLDREKLAVLAEFSSKSSSEWLIDQIRLVYEQHFGDTDPKRIISHHNK